MQAVGVDIFHTGGRDWLVMIDRYSGFPFVARLPSLGTHSVICTLEKWFWTFGLPDSLRSDGGPQFSGREFASFLSDLDIKQETSSPYNPTSNGLAEAGVKQVSQLMQKCIETGENYDVALHHY